MSTILNRLRANENNLHHCKKLNIDKTYVDQPKDQKVTNCHTNFACLILKIQCLLTKLNIKHFQKTKSKVIRDNLIVGEKICKTLDFFLLVSYYLFFKESLALHVNTLDCFNVLRLKEIV